MSNTRLVLFLIVYTFFYSHPKSTFSQQNIDCEILETERYLILEQGTTYCRSVGNVEDPAIIFIGGFTTTCRVWDNTISALCNLQIYMVSYDLYGFGDSDRPGGDYNKELFIGQLQGLIAAERINKPFVIIASSMGATIATMYACENPGEIDKLILLAPAGLKSRKPLLVKILRTPYIGELIARSLVKSKRFFRRAAGKFFSKDQIAQYADVMYNQFQKEGTVEAVLSTFRNFPLDDACWAYEAVGNYNIPTYVIWGREDSIVPVTGAETLSDLIPNASIFIIDNAEHIIQCNHPELVNEQISNILSTSGSKGTNFNKISNGGE
ncbi:MAG: alpha/beta hydrolase [Candidatus Marinimicrobia bacterium]|nr:alpha/beta hydrolase [Candidatus Neomarinimicrobiota bacterium]